MADDVVTSAGTGDGATFAADLISSVYFPRVKFTIGADGVNDGDVCATNPLPVLEPSSAAALTALQLIDNASVAHDAAAVAGVTQIGLEARNTEPTAVSTTGDAVRALATMLGKQVTLPYALPPSTWQYAAASGGITDTADVAAQAAGASGVRHYITSVQVMNGHATVSTAVVIKDGSTVLWRGFVQAAGGTCSARFDPPLRGTAATAVNIANITNSSATYFNLQGFDAKE